MGREKWCMCSIWVFECVFIVDVVEGVVLFWSERVEFLGVMCWFFWNWKWSLGFLMLEMKLNLDLELGEESYWEVGWVGKKRRGLGIIV